MNKGENWAQKREIERERERERNRKIEKGTGKVRTWINQGAG